MLIGLLTSSYPRHRHDLAGGFVADLAGWLAAQGDTVEVLAPEPARGDDRPRVTVRPVRYALSPRLFFGAGAPDNLSPRAGDTRRWRCLAAWAQVPSFLAAQSLACRRRRALWDAVLSHWLLPSSLVAAVAARPLPHLAVAHSSDVNLLCRAPGASTLLHLIARPRTALVLTSEALRAPLAEIARDRAARRLVRESLVLRMGIHPLGAAEVDGREHWRQHHGLDGQTVVLFLGRLVPVKGVAQLLEAAAAVPSLTVVIVGDGPERRSLEARAARLGTRALFVGEQVGADKHAWLRAADLLVAPSQILPDGRTDSAPLVLLEAMAASLPVVATDVGGNPELIRDGDNGLLVPPGSIAALREALLRLHHDADERARLARRGDETAEAHTWDRVGPRLRELLCSL
jgi:glycosyltransferase involved in cell wall biosynthesis